MEVMVTGEPPEAGVDTEIEVETTPIWPSGRVTLAPLFCETDVLAGGAVIYEVMVTAEPPLAGVLTIKLVETMLGVART